MRVLDLFSGIGGFSLGLERAGMRTVAFCEIEPFCRAVLAQHWPEVPIYDDVRTLTADTLRRDGITVDVICGGFPCQDISFAGKRAGLEGARSGLWGEYRRLIGELRPRFVVVENVPGLLSLGMATVLGDLSALGYDATWDCVPASAVGAPHRRDRVWLVAYATDDIRRPVGRGMAEGVAASGREAAYGAIREGMRHSGDDRSATGGEDVANTIQDATSSGRSRVVGGAKAWKGPACGSSQWLAEPDVGRVADGVPARVDRLRSLGNAVVPQIPEIIGRAIMSAVEA